MRKTLSTLAASALLLGVIAMPATAAHAAELDCGDALSVFPLSSSGTKIFGTPEEAVSATSEPTALLEATGACQVGLAIQPYVSNTGLKILKIERPGGGSGFVNHRDVAAYTPIDDSELTDYSVVLAMPPSSNIAAGLLAGSRDAFAQPGFPMGAANPVLELRAGQVVRTSHAAENLVSGSNKIESSFFRAIADPTTEGNVLFADAQILAALPSTTDKLRDFEISTSGWHLYSDPSSDTADSEIESGTVFQATAMQNGWRYSSEGWLKAPSAKAAEDQESGGALSAAKEKAGELYGAAKEKASSATDAVKKKTTEAQTQTLTVWNTPAGFAAMVLAVLAMVFALIPVRRVPRGLSAVSPQVWAFAALGFVGAPLGFALSITSVAIAPAGSWLWLQLATIAVSVLAAALLGRYVSKMKPGAAPEDIAALKLAAKSPVSIGAGVIVAAVSVAGPLLLGGGVAVIPAAAVAGIAVFIALVARSGRHEAEQPETEDSSTGADKEEVKI